MEAVFAKIDGTRSSTRIAAVEPLVRALAATPCAAVHLGRYAEKVTGDQGTSPAKEKGVGYDNLTRPSLTNVRSLSTSRDPKCSMRRWSAR
jgi:hypothetical protein